MQKIKMLGTGHGFVYKLYNTCFLLQNDDKFLLVDTGGSAEIVKRLEESNIKLIDIHDIFISHCHTDHILGLMWMLKKYGGIFKQNLYKGKLNIYCNAEVSESINSIYPHIFPKVYVDLIKEHININILQDGEKIEIAGLNFEFFDVNARGNSLYGFETILENGKRLVFLGDETCNPILYNKIRNSNYLMHEAFCLDEEEKIFKAYEKHHSTVKRVCIEMNQLNIDNLILFHTEDTHADKKELYKAEAKAYFDGNVIVPNDMDEIILN